MSHFDLNFLQLINNFSFLLSSFCCLTVYYYIALSFSIAQSSMYSFIEFIECLIALPYILCDSILCNFLYKFSFQRLLFMCVISSFCCSCCCFQFYRVLYPSTYDTYVCNVYMGNIFGKKFSSHCELIERLYHDKHDTMPR